MKFKLWLENEVQQEADELISRFKDFKSSSQGISPSILYSSHYADYDYNFNFDILDLAAVIAGTKPAALIYLAKYIEDKELLEELLKRARLAGLKIEYDELKISGGYSNFFTKDRITLLGVGRPQNMQNIAKAYNILNNLKSIKTPDEIQKALEAHRIIGTNLGYPLSEVEKYLDKQRGIYENGQRSLKDTSSI